MLERASTFGRYKILAELGRGAMGIVYKGYDPKINRLVAIKTISLTASDASTEHAYRARFFCEAEAAGRLSHPRIVPIFDIGEDPETSSPYIVMEYVAGRTLEGILNISDDRLPLHTSLQLIQEVAEALDYAHLQGVVHRDVKPSNIIIADDGHAKIADFGIARLHDSDSMRAGHSWGTPAYMSPEQFKGEAVDGRSDLFSLGVILYMLLTGHRPFQGNSALTISLRVVNRDPVPATAFNARLSPEFDRVISRAIAKDPADRYQTGMEMVLDLERVRNGIESPTLDAAALLPEKEVTDRIPSLEEIFFNSPSHADAQATNRIPRVPKSESAATGRFSRPWQQQGVAFFTIGCWILAFSVLWQSIPNHTTFVVEDIASNPVALTAGPAVVPPDVISTSPKAHTVEPSLKTAKAIRQPSAASSSPAHSCQLRIVVAHHFAAANLSILIDNQPAYSRSLRGTVKKRAILFKGVEGYLSDVVALASGDHHILVRILSDDGSYDESGKISGTFSASNEKLLSVAFDKSDRSMRLKLSDFQTNQSTARSGLQSQNPLLIPKPVITTHSSANLTKRK